MPPPPFRRIGTPQKEKEANGSGHQRDRERGLCSSLSDEKIGASSTPAIIGTGSVPDMTGPGAGRDSPSSTPGVVHSEEWLEVAVTEADVDLAIGITDEALTDPESFWEEQWRHFEPFVRPYESDRSAYRFYPKPLVIEVRPALWARLTKHNQLRAVVDGFMILGLIPIDLKSITATQAPPAATAAGAAASTSAITVTTAVDSVPNGSSSGSGSAGTVSPGPANNNQGGPLPQSQIGSTRHQSPYDGQDGSPAGAAPAPVLFHLMDQDHFSPLDRGSPAGSLSATAGAQPLGHGSSSRMVSFHDPRKDIEPSDKIRELELEVKELTRQLRLMKSREVSSPSHLAPSSATVPSSRTTSPLVPPTPAIINNRPYVASSTGNTPVCLQLNYLEPDLAPYCVSIAGLFGRQILPCTIVNHRYILFIAPAHPGGSVSVTVLCTVGNSLRKYCKSTWLEYKDLGQTLSHHAVNQLVSDIPLPCSNTAPDPSEAGVNTEGKSEADGLEDVETATAASNDNSLITPADDHPPLTREMLDMLSQPRVAFAVTSANGGEQLDSNGVRTAINRGKSLSMMSADGTETLASSMAVTHVTHGGSIINDAASVSRGTVSCNSSQKGDGEGEGDDPDQGEDDDGDVKSDMVSHEGHDGAVDSDEGTDSRAPCDHSISSIRAESV